MCISVAGASMQSPTNLHMWDYTQAQEQGWYLTTNQLPEDDTCFEMSIFATDKGAISGIAGGHAFLSFKNLTNLNVQFGPIFLKPDEEMTLTKWWRKSGDGGTIHKGIWYNIDTSISNSGLSDFVYITDTIKGSALSYIEEYCRQHDSYDLIGNNCCTLSTDIWNHLTANKVLGAADDPALLKHEICLRYTEKSGKTFPLNDFIGYRDSNFNFVKRDIEKEAEPETE